MITAAAQIDLGKVLVSSWAYDDTVPGPIMRAKDGDQVELTVRQSRCRYAQRHGRVQPASDDIAQHIYSYTVPHSGTYWAHHVGIQPDYGLVRASSWH